MTEKRKEAWPRITCCILLLAAASLSACSEDVYVDIERPNERPTIRFVHAPPEGESTAYRLHLYWIGYDPDGEIVGYEYALTDGDPLGFDPADTTGSDKWTSTKLADIELTVSADEIDTTVTIDQKTYARYSKMHTFFLRAVDDRGARSETIYRSFNAFTLAPHIFITRPQPESSVKTQYLPPITTFEWEGKDWIDEPWNYQGVDSVRYMHTKYSGDIVERLNKNPEEFESKWSPWFAFEAPSDSGKSTILGDDEILEFHKIYIFVVQAMDEAGAITSIFDEKTNVRRFMVMRPTGPLLTVREPYLGVHRFVGTQCQALTLDTPGGFPVNFSWNADAGEYGGTVATYRYGWDIADLADPREWDVEAGPFHKTAPQRRFTSGIHSFYIESVDNVGIVTLALIEINIVPLTMERDLLLVDDFPSEDFIQNVYFMPTETQHDEFWLDICSLVPEFDPGTDVYDTKEHSFEPPDLRHIWRYKNVIWVYGNSTYNLNAWIKTVNFTPEEELDVLDCKYTYNILQFYMQLGGHLWSCGRSDLSGGLAGCNPLIQYNIQGEIYIYTRNLFFPLYLKCEMITGRSSWGCSDTSGVNAMPYRDFCVSVLDKVDGPIRGDGTVQNRNNLHDGLASAYIDRNDPFTGRLAGIPLELHLWEEVKKPGRYFDPSVRGFYYVEIYDPEYWMTSQGRHSQSCFHPIFRMRTMDDASVLNDTPIAIWSTVHSDVVADAPGAVAAPSLHLGFPPWYFNRDEMREFSKVVFRMWDILHE